MREVVHPMFYRIRKIWQPDIFQGHEKKPPYFEGWYYKLVDAAGRHAYAIIPGMFVSDSPNNSHAFVQILNGATGESSYHRFPLDQFRASRKKLELQIGSNVFKKDYLQLNIQSEGMNVQGEISMSGLAPWPATLTSPGVMGWYAFAPFMECYHGVISLDHQLKGSLNIDGRNIDFDNGRGYTEKDWGRSFPSAYIWMQCNHFDEPGISLTASIANIPWLKGSFRGFIIGFLCQDKLYRFTTYTRATVKDVQVTDTRISFVAFNKNHSLKIRAERSGGGLLHAPYEMEMQRRVLQSLTGRISVEFWEKDNHGEKRIYSGAGNMAGIEVHGELDEILD